MHHVGVAGQTSQPSSGEGPGEATAPLRRGRAGKQFLALIAGVLVVVAGAAFLAVVAARHTPWASGTQSATRATGLPADVPSSLAYLMGLSTTPAAPAPNFTLTDQNDRRLSLSDLRGKSVVLQFMDPACVDICPIVSQETVDAYHDLGARAGHVVFLAVNVNEYHRGVAAVARYSRIHGLDALPQWHFLTGSPHRLRQVWRDYDIAVRDPGRDADVVHTSALYFIDPRGRVRYVAAPEVDHKADGQAFLPAAPLSRWGHGIALVSRSLR